MASPLIIAHRARSGPERENTVAALEASRSRGVPAAEFDVRSTIDGVLVIAHDDDIAGLPIATTRHAELLERDANLATLAQMLEASRRDMLLDVEIKAAGFESEVAEMLRAWDGSAVVTSFADSVIARVKRANPSQRTGLLLGVRTSAFAVGTRMREIFPLFRVAASGADLVVPNHRLLRLGFVERMRQAGVPIWIWTVNREADLRAHIRAGTAEGIITDEPVAAMRILGE